MVAYYSLHGSRGRCRGFEPGLDRAKSSRAFEQHDSKKRQNKMLILVTFAGYIKIRKYLMIHTCGPYSQPRQPLPITNQNGPRTITRYTRDSSNRDNGDDFRGTRHTGMEGTYDRWTSVSFLETDHPQYSTSVVTSYNLQISSVQSGLFAVVASSIWHSASPH